MEVHRGEGVANHIGPEPCVHVRENLGEASGYGNTPIKKGCVVRLRSPRKLVRKVTRQSGYHEASPNRTDPSRGCQDLTAKL